MVVRAALLAALAATAAASPTPSSRKPPMGWRSWNLFELNVSQALIEAQIAGLTRRRHSVDGKPTSLLDLGYASIGLDDGWQDCGKGINHTYHSAEGTPLVNKTRFPDMGAMVAVGHAAGVQMGWYANNCWCNEGRTDKTGWPKPYYEGNAKATVDYRFDAIKVDSCGASDNITAWREALDSAAAAAGRGRVQIENCRNYAYTKNITETSECAADFFRSTEDNAPDFYSIMANLVMNDNPPGAHGNGWGGLPVSHPGCWSYPDMLETTGSGQCRTLPNGTCGFGPSERRMGGVSRNESKAHFAAWAIVSSPLVIGHDLADDDTYDAAWPVISNPEVIRVDQAYAGDAGRLVAKSADSEKITGIDLYHGAGCENPREQSSTWQGNGEAAALAINFGADALPGGTISVDAALIFGKRANETGNVRIGSERDVWARADVARFPEKCAETEWVVSELAPHSSYFVTLKQQAL